MESRSQFSFHLDGESEIDASLLSAIIGDMASLSRIAAREVNSEAYLKMNVTTFRNGSFQIDFSAICNVAASLFNLMQTNVPVANQIISTIKGFLEIKKLLKGKPPRKVLPRKDGTVEIENKLGEKISVPKTSAIIIENMEVDQLTVNISNYALEHNPDGGFSFSDENGALHCTAKDVENMAKPLPIKEETICRRTRVETSLPIRKADFIGRSRWGFTYNKKTIEASICDDAFLERVHNGETIKKGDYINATLEIYTDLDANQKPIPGSEKYSVIAVHGSVQHEAEQLKLTGI